MMVNISKKEAKVKIKLDGDVSDFNSKLNETNKRFDEFNQKISKTKKFSGSTQSGLNDLASTFLEVGAAVTALVGTYSQFINSALEVEKSQNKLIAAAKITGTSYLELSRISQQVRIEFALSASESNEFAIILSKLTTKAGETEKTKKAIEALLNVGAAQGLSASESLVAINQALLGLDEGTDKLFQKNPSVIYEEFAKKAGLTAASLSDAQKAQALLNEVFVTGAKVAGSYNSFLGSAAGQIAKLKTDTENLSAAIGSQLLAVLRPMISLLDTIVNLLSNQVVGGFSAISLSIGSVFLLVSNLNKILPVLRAQLLGVKAALSSFSLVTAGVVAVFELYLLLNERLKKSEEERVRTLSDLKEGLRKLTSEGYRLGKMFDETSAKFSTYAGNVSKAREILSNRAQAGAELDLPTAVNEREKLQSQLRILEERKKQVETNFEKLFGFSVGELTVESGRLKDQSIAGSASVALIRSKLAKAFKFLSDSKYILNEDAQSKLREQIDSYNVNIDQILERALKIEIDAKIKGIENLMRDRKNKGLSTIEQEKDLITLQSKSQKASLLSPFLSNTDLRAVIDGKKNLSSVTTSGLSQSLQPALDVINSETSTKRDEITLQSQKKLNQERFNAEIELSRQIVSLYSDEIERKQALAKIELDARKREIQLMEIDEMAKIDLIASAIIKYESEISQIKKDAERLRVDLGLKDRLLQIDRNEFDSIQNLSSFERGTPVENRIVLQAQRSRLIAQRDTQRQTLLANPQESAIITRNIDELNEKLRQTDLQLESIGDFNWGELSKNSLQALGSSLSEIFNLMITSGNQQIAAQREQERQRLDLTRQRLIAERALFDEDRQKKISDVKRLASQERITQEEKFKKLEKIDTDYRRSLSQNELEQNDISLQLRRQNAQNFYMGALAQIPIAVIQALAMNAASTGNIFMILAAAVLAPILVGALTSLIQPPSFATGGIVDSPTLAVVGDAKKAGASTNREFILNTPQMIALIQKASLQPTITITNVIENDVELSNERVGLAVSRSNRQKRVISFR
ncbi:MAG: hypothetical protein SFU91_00645 [Chloroherpetonaceae bacterium]|nr:hypothetical protein [Chloroherpetonaceae bacterium]